MARIRGRWWAVVGLACVWAAAGAWAAEAGKAPAAILKHAVICPPFKGDAAIAAMLRAGTPLSSIAWRAVASVSRQISSGSCSTQPNCG